MKIKFVDEYKTREVEKIGTVQCVRSEFDSSWEFPINKYFPLYQENLDDKICIQIIKQWSYLIKILNLK